MILIFFHSTTKDRTPNSRWPRTVSPRPALYAAALWAFCALAALACSASADLVLPPNFHDEIVVSGLNAPVNSTTMADGRLLFVEQYTGKVRMIVNGALASTDPVGVVPEVRAGGESGLVGIATDPNWPARPYVYVMANHQGSATVRLWRFRLTGDLTNTAGGAMTFDPASRYTVIGDIPDNSPSHQAGSLRFGNDGMLYVAVGDDEQGCVALDVKSLLGKILRIDVSQLPDGPGGPSRYATLTPPGNPFASNPDSVAKLVWIRGLRNPYMTWFDPVSSTLVVGDVGDRTWEEIDLVKTGGKNYGWPMWEGPARTGVTCANVDTTKATRPDYAYEHETPGYSIFAGPIYRAPAGAAYPFPASYEGDVFFGDTWKGFVRRLDAPRSGRAALTDSIPGQPDSENWATGPKYITSMSIAKDGSLLYFLIYRTVPTSGPGELHRIRYLAPAVGVGDPGDDVASEARVSLDAPWPAPSSGSVDFAYRLARPSTLRLAIYDARGREVRTLLDARSGVRATGPGRASWDGRDAQGRLAPAGVYFARLDAAGEQATRRFVRIAPPTP